MHNIRWHWRDHSTDKVLAPQLRVTDSNPQNTHKHKAVVITTCNRSIWKSQPVSLGQDS